MGIGDWGLGVGGFGGGGLGGGPAPHNNKKTPQTTKKK